jgi:hypothetical protein
MNEPIGTASGQHPDHAAQPQSLAEARQQIAALREELSVTVEELQVMGEELSAAHEALAGLRNTADPNEYQRGYNDGMRAMRTAVIAAMTNFGRNR